MLERWIVPTFTEWGDETGIHDQHSFSEKCGELGTCDTLKARTVFVSFVGVLGRAGFGGRVVARLGLELYGVAQEWERGGVVGRAAGIRKEGSVRWRWRMCGRGRGGGGRQVCWPFVH